MQDDLKFNVCAFWVCLEESCQIKAIILLSCYGISNLLLQKILKIVFCGTWVCLRVCFEHCIAVYLATLI
jgi:hypothetical protein